MLEVALFPGLPAGAWARLRCFTGADEEQVDPADPAAFGKLLDGVLQRCEGTTVGPGRAFDLAITDHDRIALALYRQEFGERLESRLVCGRCGKQYELSFSLDALAPPAPPLRVDGIKGPDQAGHFALPEGIAFRLPSLRDQLAVHALDPVAARRELLRRCLKSSVEDDERLARIEEAMELVGPLAAGETSATCPHCGNIEEGIRFSIQPFLLEALGAERRFLHHEIHHLARFYAWTRSEILAMTKNDRRLHVRMVLAQQSP